MLKSFNINLQNAGNCRFRRFLLHSVSFERDFRTRQTARSRQALAKLAKRRLKINKEHKNLQRFVGIFLKERDYEKKGTAMQCIVQCASICIYSWRQVETSRARQLRFQSLRTRLHHPAARLSRIGLVEESNTVLKHGWQADMASQKKRKKRK